MSDLRQYCETTDVGRLVARNIRYNLAGAVGKNILATYESDQHDFWYVHNGITIVCDLYSEKSGIGVLTNPSVVNGAQTLYAISNSSRRVSKALVATRVIVRGEYEKRPQEDDQWVQKIISGVNTQNRVRAQDFRSNDPTQIELQNCFRTQKVFYERKRGEWRENRNEPRFRGFERASLKDIGMALTAIGSPDGAGVVLVKRGAEIIFGEDKYYFGLFPSRVRISRRFKQVYFAYRLARFVRDYGHKTSKEARRRRHAYWTTVWLTHAAMANKGRFFSTVTIESIRSAFDQFEKDGLVGIRARKAIRSVCLAVWAAWRQARHADLDQWTANNFFKSKWGNDKVLHIAWVKVRRTTKLLCSELQTA
jgi:hypothetical protein